MIWVVPRIPVSLPITSALILGISWQALGGGFWIAYGGFCVITGIAAYCLYDTKKFWYQLLGLLFLLGIFCVGGVRHYYQHKKFLDFYYAAAECPLNVTGTIIDIENVAHENYQQIVTLKLLEAQRGEIPIPEAKNQIITVYLEMPVTARVSDIIASDSIILRYTNNNSYKQYLIKEGIAASVFLKNQKITVIPNQQFSIKSWLHQKRKTLTDQLRGKMSVFTFSLFSTIFLGYKHSDAASKQEIAQDFKIWGIMHYLARSGLHLVLFIMLWKFLFDFLPLSFLSKQLIMISLVSVYLAFSWSSVSFNRALVTFLLYKTCSMLDLPINAVHLLALVCGAVLLYNPYQLFFLDFQLSFALTFALAWFNDKQNY